GSIVYAALAGEEQGLFGGRILAEHARRNGWRIEAVLNNDMIGNTRGITGVLDNTSAREYAEGTRVTETPDEARARRFTGRFGRGGHHRPFNDLGYPAVRIMETHEDYTRQHQDLRLEDGIAYGDTIDAVDFDYAAKLTGLNAAVLAGLAWAPPPPAAVSIGGAVTAHTTLRWERPAPGQAPGLAGYRVYWRLTTEPQWTHSRWVGDVGEYTLENVVIDNYFFGVAAVGKDGNESPVVFPGAAGSFGGY